MPAPNRPSFSSSLDDKDRGRPANIQVMISSKILVVHFVTENIPDLT